MYCTLSGIRMLVRLLQPLNALTPMPATPSEMVAFSRLLQSQKAYCPRASTPLTKTDETSSLWSYHGHSEASRQYCIVPVPLMVSSPLLSSVQVTLSPSLPQSPLYTISAPKAVTGMTPTNRARTNRTLTILFFI